jgi:hypothetical protein
MNTAGRDPSAATDPELPCATIEELQRWSDHGAVWRVYEVTDERAVIDLCSCTGEPMERVQSSDRELIEFVRAHRAD